MQHRTTVMLSVIILTTLLAGAGTISTVIFSTPKDIGPGGVTFWFVGLLIFLTGLLTLAGYFWKIRKTKYRENSRSALIESFRTAFLLSFTGVVLLALQSLRSLNIRDIILFVLTVLIIEFYFRTRRA